MALAALTLALPRYIALKCIENQYLSYNCEGGEFDGYLCFNETAVSPYAKFEVERASKDGLVHIRSCRNNKYWVRAKPYWIAAAGKKPEEDQTKESCTLFKLIPVDHAKNTVRFVHVQSGCHSCFWNAEPPFRSMLSYYKDDDKSGADIFTMIDWESLCILPKHVAFKGQNNNYMCLRTVQSFPFMMFNTDDIADSDVACEIFVVEDGNIRIKSTCSNLFWRLSPTWIWVDSNDTTINNKDTWFRPVKVDNQTIGLLSLGINRFCKPLTAGGKTDCLNAAVYTLTKEAQLRVEEPVLTREIYNVKYDLDNSRIYDEKVLLVATNSASNYTQQSSTLDVKLSYTETNTRTWKNNFSLKLAMKCTIDMGVPLVSKDSIEISSEIQSGVEWGETKTSTTVLEVVHKVVAPPMTKVTVNLIATNGKCDVPFTFTQKDTFYNATTTITEIDGGTFTGCNHYNIDFQTKEEKLT